MRVLFVITRGDSIGGAQIHVLSLAQVFKQNGHDVLICYGGKIKGPFNKLINQASINYTNIYRLKREISIIDDLKTIFLLRKIINNFQPDIISLHSSKAGILGRLSGLFLDYPTVLTVHGWAFTEGVNLAKSIFYKSIEKCLSPLATKIIVVSTYDKKIALENKISKDNKIEVIHNGIEVLDLIKLPLISKDVIDIIMIARFDEQKDHETLIKACKNINNIRVHLLGDGPNLNKMFSLVNELNMNSKFIFYGYTTNAQELLKKSDIFVLISNWEGFPISTLEAMKYSLPVIVSDVGGAKEAIKDGMSGYLIKRKDVDGLNMKLRKLINDVSLRQSMGSLGRKILIDNFSLELMYDKTYSCFLNAIKSNKV